MIMKNLYLLGMALLIAGCQSSFLDVKPSMQTVVPISLDDFESLLYDENTFRVYTPVSINLIGSDEYYVLDGAYNSYSAETQWVWHKYAYTWDKEIYSGQELYTDWSSGYKRILQTNVVLDGLTKLTPAESERQKYDRIMGMVLFHRAFAYYCLAQVYCPVYRDAESAVADLGLPLRTKGDPTFHTPRSSLADTYRFIIEDLLSVIVLIPKNSLQYVKTDPTAEAAHALLSRLYLQLGDYESAERHALACIQQKNELLDYRLLDKNADMPFPNLGKDNPEVLFYNTHTPVSITTAGYMNVSPDFMALYVAGDLRKELYFSEFNGLPYFNGGYTGIMYSSFGGIALDEVYLNLAECLARRGAADEALVYLNKLRKHRFEADKFVAYSALDKEETLLKVLEERKRQLYFRGLRWEDLRRLNKEPKFRTAIHRTIAGVTYALEPGSNLWTWPIPPTAIANGGYTQNPR